MPQATSGMRERERVEASAWERKHYCPECARPREWGGGWGDYATPLPEAVEELAREWFEEREAARLKGEG